MRDLTSIITAALEEDIGDGDHTTLACIDQNASGTAKLLVKENGVIAGVELAQMSFAQVDNSLSINILIHDGAAIKPGDVVFEVSGSAQSILKAERLVLNFMQRMSGIATHTAHLSKLIEGTNTKICDTRKTTPNLRIIEKWAVRIGGGVNHRFGLYDMILIKDNHIDFAGGIKNAIERTQKYLAKKGKGLKVEIEARNMDELHEILEAGNVDRIMLDNFSPEEMRQAVKLIDGNYETEASGGITEKTIRNYAETGVDFISVGALTHQIKSLDLSLKAVI